MRSGHLLPIAVVLTLLGAVLAAPVAAWAAGARPAAGTAEVWPARDQEGSRRDEPQAAATVTPISDTGGGGRDEPQAPSSPTEAPTETGPALIAYAGIDGNIWLTLPDGTGQQPVTTTGTPDRPFERPRWSPDGTMLVFEGGTRNEYGYIEREGIYLFRNGLVARVPRIRACGLPVFTADSSGLAFACGGDRFSGSFVPTEEELSVRPDYGFISTSGLDGRDWRVVIPFHIGGNPDWQAPPSAIELAVSSEDGAFVATTVGTMAPGAVVYEAEGGEARYVQPSTYLSSATFVPRGENLVAIACEGDCFHSNANFTESIVLMGRSGRLVETYLTLPPDVRGGTPSLSPDRDAVTFAMYPASEGYSPSAQQTIFVASIPDGSPAPIAQGADPDWQPVAAALTLPNLTGATGTVTVTAVVCPFDDSPGSMMTNTTEAWLQALPSSVPLDHPGCTIGEPYAEIGLEGPDGQTQSIAAGGGQAELTLPIGRYRAFLPYSGSLADWELTADGAQLLVVVGDAGDEPAIEPVASGPDIAAAFPGQLAYGVKLGEQWDIYLHDFSTKQNTQLTVNPESDEWAPAWSHDGSQLAYLSDAADGSNQVWVMNPDGSGQRQVTDYGGDEAITYVAWSSDDQGFVLTLQGASTKRLVAVAVAGGEFAEYVPPSSSFACIGSRGALVYVADSETNPGIVLASESDPTGQGELPVSRFFDGDAPNLAPGTSLLAYHVGPAGARQIRLENLEPTGGPLPTVPWSGGDDSNPVWASDHTAIAFVADLGNLGGEQEVRLYQIGAEDSTVVPIAPHDLVWYLAWRP